MSFSNLVGLCEKGTIQICMVPQLLQKYPLFPFNRA